MNNLICFCLLFFWSPTLINAQQEELSDPVPYFMAVIVSDIDASIHWYGNTLGFDVLTKVDMSERGFRQANLKRGKAALELIEFTTALYPKEILKDQPKKTRIAGFFKFGFSVNDFDEWVSHLSDKIENLQDQIVKDPISGKRMMIILDPDGNRIQLFEQ